jgi:peptidoglycan/LPS O-acetylase OafA/YrhL
MYRNNNGHRIFGLDFVRALAILMVLCSHSTLLLFPNTDHIVITIFQFFGTIGVDLFFVLSGFLIGSLLLKEINKDYFNFKQLFHFWIRRWFRTLPNYFLVLIINIILFYIFYSKIIDGVGLFFVFLQNFSPPHPNFFTEAWSLSIEEYAYILGPFLVLLLSVSFKRIDKKLIFIGVTCFIVLISALLRYKFHLDNYSQVNQDWSKFVRKVVIYRIDSVYYGFIGAYIAYYFNLYWRKYKVHAFVLGLAVFFSMHGLIFMKSSQPETTSLFFNVFYLPLISISLLLLFPVLSSWNSKVILSKTITNISLWSYSLYLINYSIVLLSIQYFIDVELESSSIKFIILIVFWAISLFLSFLLYNFYEKPLTKYREASFIVKYF